MRDKCEAGQNSLILFLTSEQLKARQLPKINYIGAFYKAICWTNSEKYAIMAAGYERKNSTNKEWL